MIKVLLESPFRGNKEMNIMYAHECFLDCLKRDETPFASHLLYTQMLDDDKPDERDLGIKAGLEWGKQAEKTVVYTDFGISSGMQYGIDNAKENNRPIEYRKLYENKQKRN